ncbi:uncharacterized protein LOC144928284 [Branchiostoma floridae x Branchiostoma belcheri]
MTTADTTTQGSSGPTTTVSTSATSPTASQATTSQQTTATAGPTTTGPTPLSTTSITTPEGTTQSTTPGATTQAGTGSTAVPTTVTSFTSTQSATQSTTKETTSPITSQASTTPATGTATTQSTALFTGTTTQGPTETTASLTTADTTTQGGSSGPTSTVSSSATSPTASQATTSQQTTATAGPTTTGPTPLSTTSITTPEGTTQSTTPGATTQAGTGSTAVPTTVTSFTSTQSATQSTTKETTSPITSQASTTPAAGTATTQSTALFTGTTTQGPTETTPSMTTADTTTQGSSGPRFSTSSFTQDTTSRIQTTHLIGIQSTSTLSEITSQQTPFFTTLQSTEVSQGTYSRSTSSGPGEKTNPTSTIYGTSQSTDEPISSSTLTDAIGKSSTQPSTIFVITGVIGRRSTYQSTSLSATDESTTLPTAQTMTTTENTPPASADSVSTNKVTNQPTQTTDDQASTVSTLFDISACQQEVARLQEQNEQLLRILYGTASVASLLLVISTKVIVQAAHNLYKKWKLPRSQGSRSRPSTERRVTPEGSEDHEITTNNGQTNDVEQGVKKTGNAWQPVLPPVQLGSRTITLPAPRRASDGGLSRPKLTFYRRGGVVVPAPPGGAGPFPSTQTSPQDLPETRLPSDETFIRRKSKQGDLLLPQIPPNIRGAIPTAVNALLPTAQTGEAPTTSAMSPEESFLAMKAKQQENLVLPKLPLPRRGSIPIRTREPLPSVQTLLSNAGFSQVPKKTEEELRGPTPIEEGQNEIPGVVNAEELSLPPILRSEQGRAVPTSTKEGNIPAAENTKEQTDDETKPVKEMPEAQRETTDEKVLQEDEEEETDVIKEETDEQLEEEKNRLQDRRGSKLTEEDKLRMAEILKAQTERRQQKMRKRRDRRKKKEEAQVNEEEEIRRRAEVERRNSIVEEDRRIVVEGQRRKIMEEERIKVEAPILDELEPALEQHDPHELETYISAFYSAKLTDDTGLLKETEGIYDAIQAQHDLTEAFAKRDLVKLDEAMAAAERIINTNENRPAPPPVRPGGIDPLRARRIEMWKKAAEENKKVTDRLSRQLHQADKIKQLEKLRREVLDASQVTISEIRNYNHPPQKVHQVMTATYLLLGVKERETEDWRNVQALMGHSLTKKIQHINPSRVRLQTALRAQEILNNFTPGQIRDVSAGAASFYHWAQGVIQVVISSHHAKAKV